MRDCQQHLTVDYYFFSITGLGGPLTATCLNNRQCWVPVKKWGEKGEQRVGGRWVDHAKIHRKTEHNQIRRGQNPVFTELYDGG